jgi:hypothetical protein
MIQSWFIARPFPFVLPVAASEVPVTNKPRRACLYVIADHKILKDFPDDAQVLPFLISAVSFRALFWCLGAIER